jgi:hypothetical protein
MTKESEVSIFNIIQTSFGAHPATYQMGTWGFSLEVKQPWHEAYKSPPTSAGVRKTCIYTNTPTYIFMVYCLVKHGDNFTLASEQGCESTNLKTVFTCDVCLLCK